MSPKADTVLAAAMELSEDERIELADRLLASLTPERQAEIDRSWEEEAERRFKAYQEGRVESVPYEEAMRSVRGRLKR